MKRFDFTGLVNTNQETIDIINQFLHKEISHFESRKRMGVVSIRPNHTCNILNGYKEYEVRKKPVPVGTLMFIYACMGHKKQSDWLYRDANLVEGMSEPFFLDRYGYRGGDYEDRFLCGKIVGCFIVDEVQKISVRETTNGKLATRYMNNEELCKKTCLSNNELEIYAGSSLEVLYAWHISNLKIFKKPLPLSCCKKNQIICEYFYKKHHTPSIEHTVCDNCKHKNCSYSGALKRPPQSYCFIDDFQIESSSM